MDDYHKDVAPLAASRKDMQVQIATEPIPPMLNNARLEWVSIYLGRKPYEGVIQLREQMVDEALQWCFLLFQSYSTLF